MIPILYESTETNFNHNGLGLLSETIECTVTEARNGEFELFLEYPVSGKLYNKIKDFVIIKAKPNRLDEEQHLFRVYDYEMDIINQTVLVYAHSKTNDLAGNMVLDLEINNQTAQEALNLMKANLVEATNIMFYSDIETRSSTHWERRNPLNCLVGERGSLVDYWGGEIKRRNEIINLYRRRGNDNVTTIRHGKNLIGLKAEYSTKGMVTSILPVFTHTEKDKEETIIGDIVDSKYANHYPVKFIKEVDYSNDDSVSDLESLNRRASQYFVENTGVDLPRVKMEVDMDDLSDSSEYEKFKDLERIELTDTVTIYAEKFDVHITARVNKMTFNVLTEKVEKLEIGSVQTGLVDNIESDINDKIDRVESDIHVVQLAANGKNKIYRGKIRPEGGSLNDLWYKPVGDGETELYRFDGSTWVLEKVSAGLLGGTLDAENGDVNLINVNVNNLVGNISEFVKTYWNAINSRAEINGDHLRFTHDNGSYTELSSKGLMRYDSGTGKQYHYMTKIIKFVVGGDNQSPTTKWIGIGSEFNNKQWTAALSISDSMTASSSQAAIHRIVLTQSVDGSGNTIQPRYRNGQWEMPVMGYKTNLNAVEDTRRYGPIAGIMIVTA